MGFAKTWVAVRGASRESVLAGLGLAGTGQFEELAESPFDGAALPSGWYLVEGECADERLIDENRLARLASAGEVVTLSVEEHTMFSAASGWRAGRQIWSITHDSSRGVDHLEVSGNPPAGFAAIRDRARAEQSTGDSDVDYVFEVPVDLAREVTGYRHDQDIEGAGETPYEIIEPAAAPKPAAAAPRRARPVRREEPSFWKRLFGG